MRFVICILLALVPAAGRAEPAGERTCRILFLGAPDNAPEKLHLFDGKFSREVELPQMNLSPVYKLPAGPLVVRLMANAPAKPEEVDPGAPKAPVAETIKDFFLLVTPDPANKTVPVKLQVIDGDASKFGKGEMMWYNLTPYSIGGKVGSEQLAMAANSKANLKPPAATNEDYAVSLAYRKAGDKRPYPLCETKWLHDPKTRTLLFVIVQPGSTTPRVLGFPDHRSAGEADP
jgi:hypothetical protein